MYKVLYTGNQPVRVDPRSQLRETPKNLDILKHLHIMAKKREMEKTGGSVAGFPPGFGELQSVPVVLRRISGMALIATS